MWVVEYKPDNNSEAWVILDSHDNKTSACFKAFRLSVDCFMVKVTEPDGSVIWSN
jgi:hypothetical protein